MTSARERAKIIYLRSGCTVGAAEIAKELHISPNTVKSWKKRDRWDDDPRAVKPQKRQKGEKLKSGSQPGNRKAVYAQREGNQNALKTGEFAKIMLDDLTEEEKALLEAMPDDQLQIIRDDLRVLTVREYRMMRRISAIQASADARGLVRDTVTRTSTGRNNVTITTDRPAFDRIIRLEEALTRVRAEKQKAINSLNEYKIKSDALALDREKFERGNGSDDPQTQSLTIVYDYGTEE